MEKGAGYDKFARRHESPVREELEELCAKTRGTAAKLASTLRKAKTLGKLFSFMVKILDKKSPPI